jgi:stearoyl-CoA desaturase (delta-9 desaturase)
MMFGTYLIVYCFMLQNSLTFWSWFGYMLLFTHITIVAVTVFLHRHQAHRSLSLHPVVSHFFRLWLWLTTGMVTKEWVAIHRKHHATCDTKDDPHSPVFYGMKKLLLAGVLLYVKESSNKETMEKYGQNTPDDWLERNIYAPYSVVGITISFIFDVFVFGALPGIAMWLIQMAWIPFWAAGVINGAGHGFGYRTFASKDAATNLFPWGILIGGEELHNNHHAFPRSAKLSYQKWEFDIGWMYIKLLTFFGLAKVLERSPEPESSTSPFSFDSTLALFSAKMKSIRKYELKVLFKVLKDDVDSIASAMQHFKLKIKDVQKLLSTEYSMLKVKEQEMLNKILEDSSKIRSFYDLKQNLSDVWHGVGISLQDRMERTAKWCDAAAKLGNQHVNRFVLYIKRKVTLA